MEENYLENYFAKNDEEGRLIFDPADPRNTKNMEAWLERQQTIDRGVGVGADAARYVHEKSGITLIPTEQRMAQAAQAQAAQAAQAQAQAAQAQAQAAQAQAAQAARPEPLRFADSRKDRPTEDRANMVLTNMLDELWDQGGRKPLKLTKQVKDRLFADIAKEYKMYTGADHQFWIKAIDDVIVQKLNYVKDKYTAGTKKRKSRKSRRRRKSKRN